MEGHIKGGGEKNKERGGGEGSWEIKGKGKDMRMTGVWTVNASSDTRKSKPT